MGTRNSLQENLEALARQEGVDYFGVADLTPAREYIATYGGEIVARFHRAISIGMRLFDGFVEMAKPGANSVTNPYTHHIYGVISPRLDVISLNLAHMLRNRGYDALPVPQGFSGRNTSILPYKLPAHLSGLGWIGKNSLLITPEHGPRVRFSAVLTNADLKIGQPVKDRCGGCMVCVEACPVKAFTGRIFHPDDPLNERFDVTSLDSHRPQWP